MNGSSSQRLYSRAYATHSYTCTVYIAGLDAKVSSITKCLYRWCSTKQCAVSENIHTYPITEGWGGSHTEFVYKEGGYRIFKEPYNKRVKLHPNEFRRNLTLTSLRKLQKRYTKSNWYRWKTVNKLSGF